MTKYGLKLYLDTSLKDHLDEDTVQHDKIFLEAKIILLTLNQQ